MIDKTGYSHWSREAENPCYGGNDMAASERNDK